MYYYLVDPVSYDGKNFEFFQTQLLSLLGEYHISGEVARVTRLRRVQDLVSTALSHGVTTLVIVGGDETFNEAVSFCKGKPVTLGFVPVSSTSETGKILGVGQLPEAVVAIAKRRVENLDLACVDKTCFISNLSFSAEKLVANVEAQAQAAAEDGKNKGWFSGIRTFFKWRGDFAGVEMKFDHSFTAKSELFLGSIVNTRDHASERPGVVIGDPRDGLLDAVFAGRLSRLQNFRYRNAIESRQYEVLPGASVVHASEIEILAPSGLQLVSGGKAVAVTPARIFIADEKIRVIVGKSRTF